MKKIGILLAVLLISVAAYAQKRDSDTLYVDVPEEVQILQIEAAECTAYGPRNIARFGKKYMGCSQILTRCYNGKPLDDKKYKVFLREVKYHPYDKIVFNGFVIDRMRMDTLLTFRRKIDVLPEIDAALRNAGKADQLVRTGWVNFSMGSMPQEQAVEYALEMERTDSTNLAVVERILDTYGWPDGLSKEADNAIFLVIEHSNLETMNKYLPVFKDAAKRRLLPMNDLATMEDRMLMNAGKPQIYGTQAYSITRDGVKMNYIWPVDNPDSLNERRASVGLPTIEEYLELFAKKGVEVIYDPALGVEFFK